MSQGVEPPPPLLPHVDLHPITKRRSSSRPMALIYLPPPPPCCVQTDRHLTWGRRGGGEGDTSSDANMRKQHWQGCQMAVITATFHAQFLPMDCFRSTAHFDDFQVLHRSIALKQTSDSLLEKSGKNSVRSYSFDIFILL